jgi:hypothetical protein
MICRRYPVPTAVRRPDSSFDLDSVSEKWKIFAPALKEHGGAHDVSASIESRHGTGYSVDGSLKTADLGAKDTERIPNHKDTANG